MVRAGKLKPRAGRAASGVPSWLPWAFVLPALSLFGVFLLYPLANAVTWSLFGWSGLTRLGFVGFQNYGKLLTDYPYSVELPAAILHNVAFFVGVMVIQFTIGLFLALQIQRLDRGRRLFQTLYATPYLVSPLVVGYLWTLLLSPSLGVVNTMLRRVGLDSLALPWLGEPDLALFVVVLIAAWQWLGFPVLLIGAALGGVPPELDEAAQLDGASGMRKLFGVTLPLIAGPLGTVSILTFIFTMEIFPIVYAIGGSTGSPAGALDVLALVFYRSSFQSGAPNALGMSSAIATLMFLGILGISLIANKLIRRVERGTS